MQIFVRSVKSVLELTLGLRFLFSYFIGQTEPKNFVLLVLDAYEISYLVFIFIFMVFNEELNQLKCNESSMRLKIFLEVCCAQELDPCFSVFLPGNNKCNFWLRQEP